MDFYKQIAFINFVIKEYGSFNFSAVSENSLQILPMAIKFNLFFSYRNYRIENSGKVSIHSRCDQHSIG